LFEGATGIGEICHIKAAKAGGPRYAAQQTQAERHGYDNLILLCAKHHTVIDDDEETYTVERLLKMKAEHEQRAAPIDDAFADRAAEFLINQPVMSVNQSGGITAHRINIINFHPPPVPTAANAAMPVMATPAIPALLAARPEIKETEKQNRIFVGESITPEYLLGFFHQHTHAQATNATKDYAGKWITVSGILVDVITATNSAHVQLRRQWSGNQLSGAGWMGYIHFFMDFRGSWKDRAIILRQGDGITAIGQIDSVHYWDTDIRDLGRSMNVRG
jgi:hypothetical protein